MMKALIFDLRLSKYILAKAIGRFSLEPYLGRISCLKLADIPEPKLRGPEWAKIKVKLSGICGTDLGIIFMKVSPSLSPFSSYPAVLGHEIVGEVVEAGEEVELKPGEMVVVEPFITCKVRGIKPECPPCRAGYTSLCRNAPTSKGLSPGMIIGGTKDLPGGWTEYCIAHKSQILKVPDDMDDELAVLVEPISVGLHAVLKKMPEKSAKVLVIGGGMISFSVIASLRMLGSKCHVTHLALFKYQTDKGSELGADETICLETDNMEDKVKEITGACAHKPVIGDKVFTGGFDYVYDCIGSEESLKNSLRLTREGGYMVLLGAASILKTDLTHIWQKELHIIGCLCYGLERFRGMKIRTFELAVELMRGKDELKKLITHKFRIEQYKEAIISNVDRKRFKSIKTVFEL